MALNQGQITVKAKSNINANRTATWIAGGPGTPVYNWREATMALAISTARSIAPVNNPGNAVHRGGVVGTYLLGLGVARTGNKWGRGFALSASAPHSNIVESGRDASFKQQWFSWVPEGSTPQWHDKTGARDGDAVIERSIATALAATT